MDLFRIRRFRGISQLWKSDVLRLDIVQQRPGVATECAAVAIDAGERRSISLRMVSTSGVTLGSHEGSRVNSLFSRP